MIRFLTGGLRTAYVALAVAACCRPDPAAAIDLDLGRGMTLELVLIRHGSFTEGSPAAETGRAETETQRPVTITRDFYLGRNPVTVGQFRRFVEETGYRTEAEVGTSGGFGWDGSTLVQRREFTWRNPGFAQTDEHPVTLVTYADAQAFLQWLTRKSGRQLTLPTEAQWEYACRAGTTTAHYGGATESDLGEIGWYKANSANATHPVGQKRPNAFGLYDMSGNVFQWCRDWSVPRTAAAAIDPEATSAGSATPARRVLRGGSWMRDAKHLRSAARYQSTPGTRNAENGFRVAAAAGPAAAPAAVPAGPNTGFAVPATPQRPVPTPSRPTTRDPTHASRSGGGGMSMGTIVIVVIAIVLAPVFLVLYLRSRVAGGAGSPPGARPATAGTGLFGGGGQGGRVTTAADGFWFEPDGYSAGDLLIFSYLIDGLQQQQNVRVLGGDRQYVFTGREPSDVRFQLADEPDDDEAVDPHDVRVDPTPHTYPPPRSDDESYRSNPAAY